MIIMKKQYIFYILVLILTSSACLTSYAGKIDKGFKQLEQLDYFNAKKSFDKALKKEASAAAYGLSIIYYRTDNPFHNIDSAYKYIRVSEANYSLVKSKKLDKYKAYGFTKKNIAKHKEEVSTFYFNKLAGNNNVKDWTEFLERNPEAKEFKKATTIRDSLAYALAQEKNSSLSYQSFLTTYPNSEFAKDVQADFYSAEYREQTKDGKIGSYVAFLTKFSENPFTKSAEDKMYELSTEANTVETIYGFIKKYPKNRNASEAWRRLYQVYMYDYSDQRIEQFEKEFSEYPFLNELKSDLQMARTVLIPAKSNNKFGAMDLSGRMTILPTYELVSFFHEGLALVGKDGKYGYINKVNELVIPFEYDSGTDFEQGRAMVEVEGKFGLIDRTAKMVIEAIYEDIGTFSEGLIYAQKEGKYGYFDKYGEMRIPMKFDEAYGFSKGLAKVQVGEQQSFINPQGEYILPLKYESLSFFTKDLLIFEDDEYYGLINTTGQIVLPAEFDEIGQLSYGMAIVDRNGGIGYMDSTGKIVIDTKFETFPNYVRSGQFREYTAMAKLKGKFGFVDRLGKFILPNQYNQLGEFSTLVAFNKGKQWGFVNLQNKVEIQPIYDFAESFKSGGAIVTKGNFQGVIDLSGKELIPIQQEIVERMDLARYLIKRDGLSGVYSADGKVIVPVEYEEIRQLQNDFYVLIKGNRLDYLYLPENKLIRLKIK
jgi:hypothetical protein